MIVGALIAAGVAAVIGLLFWAWGLKVNSEESLEYYIITAFMLKTAVVIALAAIGIAGIVHVSGGAASSPDDEQLLPVLPVAILGKGGRVLKGEPDLSKAVEVLRAAGLDVSGSGPTMATGYMENGDAVLCFRNRTIGMVEMTGRGAAEMYALAFRLAYMAALCQRADEAARGDTQPPSAPASLVSLDTPTLERVLSVLRASATELISMGLDHIPGTAESRVEALIAVGRRSFSSGHPLEEPSTAVPPPSEGAK